MAEGLPVLPESVGLPGVEFVEWAELGFLERGFPMGGEPLVPVRFAGEWPTARDRLVPKLGGWLVLAHWCWLFRRDSARFKSLLAGVAAVWGCWFAEAEGFVPPPSGFRPVPGIIPLPGRPPCLGTGPPTVLHSSGR